MTLQSHSIADQLALSLLILIHCKKFNVLWTPNLVSKVCYNTETKFSVFCPLMENSVQSTLINDKDVLENALFVHAFGFEL